MPEIEVHHQSNLGHSDRILLGRVLTLRGEGVHTKHTRAPNASAACRGPCATASTSAGPGGRTGERKREDRWESVDTSHLIWGKQFGSGFDIRADGGSDPPRRETPPPLPCSGVVRVTSVFGPAQSARRKNLAPQKYPKCHLALFGKICKKKMPKNRHEERKILSFWGGGLLGPPSGRSGAPWKGGGPVREGGGAPPPPLRTPSLYRTLVW